MRSGTQRFFGSSAIAIAATALVGLPTVNADLEHHWTFDGEVVDLVTGTVATIGGNELYTNVSLSRLS